MCEKVKFSYPCILCMYNTHIGLLVDERGLKTSTINDLFQAFYTFVDCTLSPFDLTLLIDAYI